MENLRIALAQINSIVGDLSGNTEKILGYLEQARDAGADVVAFPEMAIAGYPPEDLLLKPDFIHANREALERVVAATQGLTAVIGFIDYTGDIHNAAAVAHDGQLAGVYHKRFLPNYGVFDEDRYFEPGWKTQVFVRDDVILGVSVCEDIWYPNGPPEAQALHGQAQVLVNISASPYYAGKGRVRERMLATRAVDDVAIVAFCNLVGGQDELVFDGGSVIFGPDGELIARARQFEEDLLVADLSISAVFRRRLHDPRRRKERIAFGGGARNVERVILAPLSPSPSPRRPRQEPARVPLLSVDAEVYKALVTGTRDYVHKNGFQDVVIGLSGGIDSTLTAAIATDALGADHVVGVSMPSVYSSLGSKEDARILAENLGIRFLTIPIQDTFRSFLETLREPFAGTEPGIAEENIQARVRGNLLMALSNKFGWMVLTTGNKSESAVGYATLYGDMAGGFAVIKDVPKVRVYALARYRNTISPVIPEICLTKPPSAELRPDQKDTDSLPPYELLDPILHAYVEEDQSIAEMVATGMDEETVRRVVKLVDRNEYKRRQAPPGIKITTRAFGKDRRLPITNRYISR